MEKKVFIVLAALVSFSLKAQIYDIDSDYRISGRLGLGTSNLSAGYKFILNSNQDIAQRTFLFEPAITTSTNYIIGQWLSSTNHNISGIDNGYRMGLRIEMFQRSSAFTGRLKSQYGIWSRVGMYENATGTIDNVYGVLIENMNNCGTIINNYGIYQKGDDAINYFDGDMGIGTTSPHSKFHVDNGDITIGHNHSENLIKTKYYGGAIRFKSSSDSYDRYLQLGNVDNNTVFHPTITVDTKGVVGIGTTTPDSKYKLSVNGTVRAKEIIVDSDWADFVFHPSYKLKPLEEVEKYIKTNNHLPDVPSEKEVKENGLSLGQSDAVLLQKIEELTLYLIEQNKTLKKQNEKIMELEREIKELKIKNN